MYVNNAYGLGTRVEATLHQFVVHSKITRIQCATNNAVCEVLPGNWQSKGIQTIIIDEMIHLFNARIARINGVCQCAASRSIGPEVQSSNVDTSIAACLVGSGRSSCREESENGRLHVEVGMWHEMNGMRREQNGKVF